MVFEALILLVALYLLWLVHQSVSLLMDENPKRFRFLLFGAIIVSAIAGLFVGRAAWFTAHWSELLTVPWSFVPYERTGSLIIWGGTLPWLFFRFTQEINWLVALWGASTVWVLTYWLPMVTRVMQPKQTLLQESKFRLARVLLGLSLLWWWGIKVVAQPVTPTDLVWFFVLIVGLLAQWRWSVMSGWYLLVVSMIGWQIWMRNWLEVVFLLIFMSLPIAIRLMSRRKTKTYEV